jgi:hypothetical protein
MLLKGEREMEILQFLPNMQGGSSGAMVISKPDEL